MKLVLPMETANGLVILDLSHCCTWGWSCCWLTFLLYCRVELCFPVPSLSSVVRDNDCL